MSRYRRADPAPDGVLYRAASYTADGTPTGACGPYATHGAAMRARHRLVRQGVTARVETCRPTWEPEPETEVTR